MDEEKLKSLKDLAALDFIPKAMIVCTLGNLINFVILSRTCIKSSTNIFLSIIALVDTLFMLFIYVYSKRYHDDVHDQTYELYWRMFGLSHWFYTALLYITVYITLSLTFDRYAAMRHPNRTKCGVVRAKNIVSMVLFVCIFFTVSSAFEFQLVSDEYTNQELCKNRSQVAENATTAMMSATKRAAMSPMGDNEKSLNLLEHGEGSNNFNEDESRLKRSLDNDVFSERNINSTDDTEDYFELSYKTSYNPADVDHYVNDAERDNAPSPVIPKRNHDTCSSHFYLYPVESSMAKNIFYRAIFKPIASSLLMLPVGLILALTCMLSSSVYRVNKVRHNLARFATTTERSTKTQTDVLIRESRLSLLVITLVVIFLICHTPNAVFLLYKSWWNIRRTFTDEREIKNFILAMEISCQILMSINCCSKIFIYLLAYDEYWTSLRSLKNCFQTHSHHPGEQIITTSKHLFPSTKADVESLLNYSLNKKRYSTQIPPEARHYQYSMSAQRSHKPSFAFSSSSNSVTPRLSLTPFDAGGIEMKQRASTYQTLAEGHQNIISNSIRMLHPGLHQCPSQASLTRSKSLNIQSTVKHSPNCRLNKKVLN